MRAAEIMAADQREDGRVEDSTLLWINDKILVSVQIAHQICFRLISNGPKGLVNTHIEGKRLQKDCRITNWFLITRMSILR
jgi:hypothetical protein